MSTSTRLFVLGLLARSGPMHGHRIRRDAELERLDVWAGVKPGSIYNALHRLRDDGLVEALREERQGRYPARTVYAITDDGRNMLVKLRQDAWRSVRVAADPFDLALIYSGDTPESTLRAAIEDRIRALVAAARGWEHLYDEARPYLRPLEEMTFRHYQLRIEAELTWHGELLQRLAELLPASRDIPTEFLDGG